MNMYNKYRPTKLKQVVGNEETKESLQAVIDKKAKGKDIPHAYLLSGASGCGKTTIGRILAKEFGCEGRDYVEINTSDFNGIDMVRDIISKLPYRPVQSKCRVYLLDEVHNISRNGQDGLLKALEDCPNHVYFILCTTDPQKLLPTLRNRCTPYMVSELDEEQLIKVVKRVCKKEKVKIKTESLELIVEQAFGSARMAIQFLEKIIDLPTKLHEKAIHQIQEKNNEAIALCRELFKAKISWKSIASIVKGIKGDAESTRRCVMGYCRSILLNSGNSKAYKIMTCFAEPFYVNGKDDLVIACYEAHNMINGG